MKIEFRNYRNYNGEKKLEIDEVMQNDFSTAISNARTDVNLHLNKIERWFYLQDCKFEDFSFEVVDSSSLEYTNEIKNRILDAFNNKNKNA